MGKGPSIKTANRVMPMIYCYITPGIPYQEGWSKIGYTEQDVLTRVKQQTHTAGIKFEIEWSGNAIYEDGSGQTFKDKAFHAYLRKKGIEQRPDENNEWFKITMPESRQMFFEFRSSRGIIETGPAVDYTLRFEQEDAVATTRTCFENDEHDEFLWNAKPRFGKTLSVYDLCKRLNAKNVLIVTNRPAVANSWYKDYIDFVGTESGCWFVSSVDDLKGKECTVSREDFERIREKDSSAKCLEFVSLQDLKGSIYFGGRFEKLKHIVEEDWDLLVIDEAHEGVDTLKTDVAFDHIKRRWTLHLSGTPFKALASNKFPQDAIYNWTYLDEQKAKADFPSDTGEENPYGDLPRLTMLTYKMSDIATDKASHGMDLGGETVEYAFDLNEFFATDGAGRFVHNEDVDRFLDALTTQDKFPFSSPDLRNELKHTLWLLDRVDSAKALARKLKNHEVFGKEYEVILAAGDGKLNPDDMEGHVKAFDRVVKAIEKYDKTITISVGQLTTGVTIPQWTGILMLSNLRSPAQYMQAAFRVQNPDLTNRGKEGCYRKTNAYVFDFDPARTLTIYEEFANGLQTDTTGGKGDSDTRREHVRELLNFFPVIGEDKDGSMEELDAEKVLSIPRRIRSLEVVRRGFMSDFLFQNIGRVFNAPPQVVDIINSFTPVKAMDPVAPTTLEIDENGDVKVPEEVVLGKAKDLFGEKIYGDKETLEELEELRRKAQERLSRPEVETAAKKFSRTFVDSTVAPMIDTAKEHFGNDLSPSVAKGLQRKLGSEAEIVVNKYLSETRIAQKTLDAEKSKKIEQCATQRERDNVENEYEKKKAEKRAELDAGLSKDIEELKSSVGERIVEDVVTRQQEKLADTVEDGIRDHLRGFSRTIPMFLMAYGDDSTTLENFDRIVPPEVFKEVTGITLEDFRFLRDGGDYPDPETGETRHFDGQLFDPVVFDDSVKEFLATKKRLANYFDDTQNGDIFDYIPPQKTNQIFTPKKVVKEMVDMLEKENPGCFDDDEATFADLYMKSGQYIAEIVRRLFNSERMKSFYPEPADRLNHIFSKQVYGLAPTEIILRIVRSYLFGFSDDYKIVEDNIRLCDTLESAKNGTMEEDVQRAFGL